MHDGETSHTAQFPAGFLWGAATSSHQVEGGNTLNDWWEWEQRGGGKGPSGSACGHYERYREDFDLAKSLGHSAHRLSVEWSRVEPRMNEFSDEALRHYGDVVAALRERGIEPIVTLNHFTLPAWFAARGGWLAGDASALFTRFVERMVERLCEKVKWWITINEPNVYVFHSYLSGFWPPQQRSLTKSYRVTGVLLKSHVEAYRAIHEIYRGRGFAAPLVGIAQNLQAFESCAGGVLNRFGVFARDKFYNFDMLDSLHAQRSLDYVGVNYYSRSLVHARLSSPRSILSDACPGHGNLPKNSLGWEIYPGGFYKVLMKLKRYRLPVAVTENGICTDDDGQRWDFIRAHLLQLARAIGDGVDVRAYLYWSLLDNFEWDKGYAPRFGLIAMDYPTGTRSVRASARKYAEVCAAGTVL